MLCVGGPLFGRYVAVSALAVMCQSSVLIPETGDRYFMKKFKGRKYLSHAR